MNGKPYRTIGFDDPGEYVLGGHPGDARTPVPELYARDPAGQPARLDGGRVPAAVIPGVSGRQGVLLGLVAVVALATAALELGGADPVVIFVVSAVALAGLAWVVSFATEGVAQHFGPAVTGVLQASLGNLPELFIVLFALSAGEVVVAQFSILGSLFANALLVLGLVILTGAWRSRDGVMRFAPRLANDTATLLLLAVFIIVLLGASDQVGDRASSHLVAISAVGAVVLLVRLRRVPRRVPPRRGSRPARSRQARAAWRSGPGSACSR